jgi:hypothetical protein
MKYALIVLSMFLFGCASAPEPREIQTKKIAEFVHKEVTPVSIPEAFTHDVGSYKDANGKTWALVDPDDLVKVEQAYISAESNAALVEQANLILELTVQRANLIRELAELEEYRALKMEVVLNDERESRREEQLRNSIESITLKIITALALVVAI